MAIKTQKVRLLSNDKFSQTDKEHLDLLRKVFKNWLIETFDYDKDELKTLIQIFDLQVTDENIRQYIHRPCSTIYTAILHPQGLLRIADYV